MEVKLLNTATLLILIWSSKIPVSSEAKILGFHNLNQAEQIQITETLKILDVYNRRTFIFTKKPLKGYIVGIAYDFYFECYVELSPEIFNPTYFKSVFYHEIGHCFGLDHTDNENDIMYFEAKSINEHKYLDWAQFLLQLNSCFY